MNEAGQEIRGKRKRTYLAARAALAASAARAFGAGAFTHVADGIL
jgi:hypothetical protein